MGLRSLELILHGIYLIYGRACFRKIAQILPAVVQLVIMLVNGNLGAGLAVMGAFALVLFRSIPGSARDIAAVFFSMAIGLATGMGFLAIAALFTLIIGLVGMVYSSVNFAEGKKGSQQLCVTIPGGLDYSRERNPVFAHYTNNHELRRLKASNLGSLYRLYYVLTLKSGVDPRVFLDDLSIRNGNLQIERTGAT